MSIGGHFITIPCFFKENLIKNEFFIKISLKKQGIAMKNDLGSIRIAKDHIFVSADPKIDAFRACFWGQYYPIVSRYSRCGTFYAHDYDFMVRFRLLFYSRSAYAICHLKSTFSTWSVEPMRNFWRPKTGVQDPSNRGGKTGPKNIKKWSIFDQKMTIFQSGGGDPVWGGPIRSGLATISSEDGGKIWGSFWCFLELGGRVVAYGHLAKPKTLIKTP